MLTHFELLDECALLPIREQNAARRPIATPFLAFCPRRSAGQNTLQRTETGNDRHPSTIAVRDDVNVAIGNDSCLCMAYFYRRQNPTYARGLTVVELTDST